MKRAAAVLLALALTGSLAACGDDGDELAPTPTTAGADTDAGATPAPTDEAAPSPAAGEGADSTPEPFPADAELDEQEPTGGPLTVTAVRVARQEDYDRVVFELDGEAAGEPGWRVEYVDEPTEPGSGDPVEVEGEAVLSVLLTGTGYPFDTGQEEVSDDPALPGDLQVVQDVVLGAVYEGQFDAYVGTASRAPFRVFRLADPARVVVDVRAG